LGPLLSSTEIVSLLQLSTCELLFSLQRVIFVLLRLPAGFVSIFAFGFLAPSVESVEQYGLLLVDMFLGSFFLRCTSFTSGILWSDDVDSTQSVELFVLSRFVF